MDEERKVLREQWKDLSGKNAFPGWSVEELKAKIEAYDPEQAKELQLTREKPNYHKYRELPPPIKEHLERTFGAWLDHMEIGQEWKKDFGGYAIYIKVPEKFSTEWKRSKQTQYDNAIRGVKVDKEGKPVMKDILVEDIRWKSLVNLAETIKWLNLVKENIINKAYSAGIQLPNTATALDETKQTAEAYKQSIHK